MIELMVVMIIMSILLAMMMPAFERMAIGGGVDGAARAVGGQLRMSRQYAIANREYIALLLPGDEINDDDKKFTAYRACIVTNPTNPVFAEWVPNTEWQFLPTGAIIETVSSGRTVNNVEGEDGIRAIVFAPTGRVLGNTQQVRVVEGAVAGDSPIIRNPDNFRLIEADTYTGRVTYSDEQLGN